MMEWDVDWEVARPEACGQLAETLNTAGSPEYRRLARFIPEGTMPSYCKLLCSRCACVCACLRACLRACVSACVLVCRVCVEGSFKGSWQLPATSSFSFQETAQIPPRRATWFSGCPGLTLTRLSRRSRQVTDPFITLPLPSSACPAPCGACLGLPSFFSMESFPDSC